MASAALEIEYANYTQFISVYLDLIIFAMFYVTTVCTDNPRDEDDYDEEKE